jgi:hypothetical protein
MEKRIIKTIQGSRRTAKSILRFVDFLQIDFNEKTRKRKPRFTFGFRLSLNKLVKTKVSEAFSMSKIQSRIGSTIRKYFSNYTIFENSRPAWLVSSKQERLELDFYIKELEVAFEVQGDQHFVYVPYFHGNYENFLNQQRRDAEKKLLCAKNGVSLYEITKEEEIAFIHNDIRIIYESSLLNAREKHYEIFVYSRIWGYKQQLAGREIKLKNLLAMNNKARRKFQKCYPQKVRKLRGWIKHFTLKVELVSNEAAREFNLLFPLPANNLTPKERKIKVIKNSLRNEIGIDVFLDN